ncbi:hypothetical protein GTA08_BOTSDO09896 [Neofusicoccum parvum]|nr:hypothetical protein GTA08_BOTSDO09896 [Neofusicoccum parvum]
MHRKTPISVLVYNHLFPSPRPEDPTSFSAHLSKNLVGEVRIETATFYGSLDTIEARYPGLNYSHPPHRKRLGRFPHHARLFRAFDELGLTETEIASLCRWEGTLWARQRYERDEGIKVLDTTGNEIGPWVDRRRTRQSSQIKVKTDIEVEIEEVSTSAPVQQRPQQQQQPQDEDMMDEDSDEEIESIGIPLNQRLIEAAARREQGATNVMMDPDWEKYLERAQERSDMAGSMPYSIPAVLAQGGVPTNPHDRAMPPAPPSAPA